MFIKYDYTADGKPIMVEVTEEVAEFLREDKRVTGNADRRERDHCEFHMDAMDDCQASLTLSVSKMHGLSMLCELS